MTAERGFALHPFAAQDITEIWEHIAKDSPLAARRVREEILSRIAPWFHFPSQATDVLISPDDPCASFWCANI